MSDPSHFIISKSTFVSSPGPCYHLHKQSAISLSTVASLRNIFIMSELRYLSEVGSVIDLWFYLYVSKITLDLL